MTRILILVTFTLLVCANLWAKEIPYYARSPKALLMGDAYTAIADDAYTLFYNPAALGLNDGLSMHFLNPKISMTNALKYMDRFENIPENDPVALTDRFLGLPLHLGLGAVPGFKLGTFGLSGLANMNANISIKNATHPYLVTDYRYDKGFATGFAFKLFGRSPKGKTKSGSRAYLGFGMKYIKREGLDEIFPIFGPELLEKISSTSKDWHDIRKSLGYSQGSAWGYDAGFLYQYGIGRTRISYGASLMDIGGTRFKTIDGRNKVKTQPMAFNTGFALNQDFTVIGHTFSFDLANLNEDMEFMRKVHVGYNIHIPLVDILLGWNGGYVSYGLGVDLFMFKLIAGFYSVETGSKYRMEESSRALIQISLLDFSFGSGLPEF